MLTCGFTPRLLPCHGAPGIAGEQIGRGINPKPPALGTAAAEWSDAQLFWIVSHALKMSGMPGFSPRLSDQDRWAIVAFLGSLGGLSPEDYRGLMSAVDHKIEPPHWGPDNQAFAPIQTANRALGRKRMRQYGCVTCHTIPGLSHGAVGPPLTAFAERQYVGGVLANVPVSAIGWIMNPKQYKPNTAMPTLGVNERDAADIAAFLYSLGSPRRMLALERAAARAQ